MQEAPILSYIITTKNKLPYLTERLERLFAQKRSDEEILIADGASTDGTRKYLEGLKRSGKIDYFISEPDYGESHALNKLLLAARGTLIKIITDDDVFSYPAIRACRVFMLAHQEIDLVSGEGGSFNQTNRMERESDPIYLVRTLEYVEDFNMWRENHTPFSFCGLGHIIRRSSLPILGLWDPSFRRADEEYALRITSGKANIAWYTGYVYVNVSNPQSISLIFQKKIKKETERLYRFYFDRGPEPFVVQKLKALMTKLRVGNRKYSKNTFLAQWPKIAAIAEKWLEIKNKKEGRFLYKK